MSKAFCYTYDYKDLNEIESSQDWIDPLCEAEEGTVWRVPYNLIDRIFPVIQNRPLCEKRLQKIASSMSVHGFICTYPLIINRPSPGEEGLHLNQGHHRLEMAKRLGLDVFVTISAFNFSELIDIEDTNPGWTNEDFLNSWADSHRDSYVWMRKFARSNGINPMTACTYVMAFHAATTKDLIRSGRLRIDQEKRDSAERMAAHIRIFDACPIGARSRTATFLSAICPVYRLKQYNPSHMEKKLSSALMRECLVPRSNKQKYLEDLSYVYSYREKEKVCFATLLKSKSGKGYHV